MVELWTLHAVICSNLVEKNTKIRDFLNEKKVLVMTNNIYKWLDLKASSLRKALETIKCFHSQSLLLTLWEVKQTHAVTKSDLVQLALSSKITGWPEIDVFMCLLSHLRRNSHFSESLNMRAIMFYTG